MGKNFLAFGLCAIVLGLLDFVWLSFATPRFYAPLMGDLLRDDIRFEPALLFYFLFAFGLSHFAISQRTSEKVLHIAYSGALIGLIGYGTYNLSALAVIEGWSNKLAIIDIAWGAFVSSTTAIISFLIIKRFFEGNNDTVK